MLPFDDVRSLREADLAALVGKISESTTLEFKSELEPDNGKSQINLLKAVSALANSAGGDLVLGASAPRGDLLAVDGLALADVDGFLRTCDQLLAGRIEPRLPPRQVGVVRLSSGRVVIAMRVPRSWNAPHRADHRFYARNSGGTYDLDVGELRSAFLQSNATAERIRMFRARRLARIQAGETPLQLEKGGRLVIHVVPFSTFATGEQIDIAERYLKGTVTPLPPGRMWQPNNPGFNLDGFFTYGNPPGALARAYCQAFRNGALECVDYLRPDETGMPYLVGNFEVDVITTVENYRRHIASLDLGFPVFVFTSLVGVRGCRFRTSARYSAGGGYHESAPIYEDVVVLPEATIADQSITTVDAMRHTFNAAWNTFGFPRSLSYSEDGVWHGPPG